MVVLVVVAAAATALLNGCYSLGCQCDATMLLPQWPSICQWHHVPRSYSLKIREWKRCESINVLLGGLVVLGRKGVLIMFLFIAFVGMSTAKVLLLLLLLPGKC